MVSRPMDDYDKIAIAEIAIYTIFFAGGILLCIKHGLSKSSGWRFTVVLSLARIIGSGLRLGTISSPHNTALYTGWLTLNGLGLGPLILVLLGLLTRVFESINRQGRVVVKATWQKLIELLMLVGMILLIVGGTKSHSTVNNGVPSIQYSTFSHIGIGVMCVVMALVCLESFAAFKNQGYAAQGEHRILIAIFVSLPFVMVRLIYGCILIFGSVKTSVWLYLAAGVIMEIVVMGVCEGVGLTLAKVPKAEKLEEGQSQTAAR